VTKSLPPLVRAAAPPVARPVDDHANLLIPSAVMANSAAPPPGQPPVGVINLVVGSTTRPFRCFATKLGSVVAQEVLSGKSYPLVNLGGDEVRTVVDIGANVGAASVYFSLCYPRARVLAFEPSPAAFSLLSRNAQEWGRIEPFNVALSDRDGRADLFGGASDSVESSLVRTAQSGGQSATTEVRDAAAMLRELGVEAMDVLKVDTEGWEVPILRSLSPLLPRAGVIYVEFHDAADRLEIDRILGPTHLLVGGAITAPHRGELRYLARGRVGDSEWVGVPISRPGSVPGTVSGENVSNEKGPVWR
jgi:FkbM family methyltransferase